MNDQVIEPKLPVIRRASPQQLAIMPKSLAEIEQYAQTIKSSRLAPKSFKTVAAITIAIASGLEVGLKPLQALQYIAVINGRPVVWGDAGVAIVQASGLLEDYNLVWDADNEEARCTVKRRGMPRAHTVKFGFAEARLGKLLDKEGPWRNFPSRMCQWRARSWCMRDVFADVLLGLTFAEEAADHADMTMVETTPGNFELQSLIENVDNPFDDDEPDTQTETAAVFTEDGSLEGSGEIAVFDIDDSDDDEDGEVDQNEHANPILTKLENDLKGCTSLEGFREIMSSIEPDILELSDEQKDIARKLANDYGVKLRGDDESSD